MSGATTLQALKLSTTTKAFHASVYHKNSWETLLDSNQNIKYWHIALLKISCTGTTRTLWRTWCPSSSTSSSPSISPTLNPRSSRYILQVFFAFLPTHFTYLEFLRIWGNTNALWVLLWSFPFQEIRLTNLDLPERPGCNWRESLYSKEFQFVESAFEIQSS